MELKERAKTDKQVVSGGFHRPVCKNCHCEMKPEINGVGILDMAESVADKKEFEYELWDADLWKCPKCGIEVIGGFGHKPICSHYESGFQKMIEYYRVRKILILNHE